MSLKLKRLHHLAIICSDYTRSKAFYTDILGLEILEETWREEKQSWKLDLALSDGYVIELFSFPSPPPRPNAPEAAGARHVAFAVQNIEESTKALAAKKIETEPVRIDPLTGKQFVFFKDPDGLPIELYEL